LKQANLGSELEGLMDDLGKRFARKSRAASTAQPTEAGK
jgi:hypothetical protein